VPAARRHFTRILGTGTGNAATAWRAPPQMLRASIHELAGQGVLIQVVRDTRSLGSSTLFLCLLICWGLGLNEGELGHTCWPLGALLLPL
jgi:hypothetical protein